jgi:menaquinone-dependent protoporphyrinogen oxidase
MRVLVVAASKHGSTAEIATALGESLARRGITAVVNDVADVSDFEGFDAVVLGSAVYAGRWQKAARELVELHDEALAARPVWLFSSGPVGEPLRPTEDPVDVATIASAIGARGHRVFPGKLDKSKLSLGEKALVMSLRVPEGDYRNWDEVAAWAGEIADALQQGPAPH